MKRTRGGKRIWTSSCLTPAEAMLEEPSDLPIALYLLCETDELFGLSSRQDASLPIEPTSPTLCQANRVASPSNQPVPCLTSTTKDVSKSFNGGRIETSI